MSKGESGLCSVPPSRARSQLPGNLRPGDRRKDSLLGRAGWALEHCLQTHSLVAGQKLASEVVTAQSLPGADFGGLCGPCCPLGAALLTCYLLLATRCCLFDVSTSCCLGALSRWLQRLRRQGLRTRPSWRPQNHGVSGTVSPAFHPRPAWRSVP